MGVLSKKQILADGVKWDTWATHRLVPVDEFPLGAWAPLRIHGPVGQLLWEASEAHMWSPGLGLAAVVTLG